jgi:predicted nucleic acid-binding protein
MAQSDAASPRFTLDTNLLVYSVDLDAGARREAALCVVARTPDLDCWLTLQSLSEFMRRSHGSGSCRLGRQRHRSMMATAAEGGCSLILTEDLQDGFMLGGVEIHNPFARGGGLTNRTQQLLGL